MQSSLTTQLVLRLAVQDIDDIVWSLPRVPVMNASLQPDFLSLSHSSTEILMYPRPTEPFTVSVFRFFKLRF